MLRKYCRNRTGIATQRFRPSVSRSAAARSDCRIFARQYLLSAFGNDPLLNTRSFFCGRRAVPLCLLSLRFRSCTGKATYMRRLFSREDAPQPSTFQTAYYADPSCSFLFLNSRSFESFHVKKRRQSPERACRNHNGRARPLCLALFCPVDTAQSACRCAVRSNPQP